MVRIEFGDLIIDELSESSGVFTGNNLQVKWRASTRIDDGFGTLQGDNNSSINNQSAVIRPRWEEK